MNELIPIKPEKFIKIPADDKFCNGKKHRQNAYCHRPAGWGTDHPGSGRCKLHGGCNKGKKSGELRYSDYMPAVVADRYEGFAVEDDSTMKSLNDEIASTRAQITWYEEKNEEGKYIKEICGLKELLRRLVETKHKVEVGITQRTTIEVVVKVVDSVIKIIDESIPDIETKRMIAGKLRRLNETSMGIANFN